MYGICYIMAGGFSALSTRSLDDKCIFVIFFSTSFAVSTLIPGLYSFLPEKVAAVICPSMVMGVGILGTEPDDVKEVNKQIAKLCEEWCTERDLIQKLQISFDSVMERFNELNLQTRLKFRVWYDQLQVKIDVRTENASITEVAYSAESFTSLSVALMMLRSIFDNVKVVQQEKSLLLHVDADIEPLLGRRGALLRQAVELHINKVFAKIVTPFLLGA